MISDKLEYDDIVWDYFAEEKLIYLHVYKQKQII